MRTPEQREVVSRHLVEALRMLALTMKSVAVDDEDNTYFEASRQQIKIAQAEWDRAHAADKQEEEE